VGTFAGANSGGACYYNNYIYCFGTGNQLAFDAQTANFTVGQTLTGGTSGATGTISAQVDSGATGTLTLKNITGTFQDNEIITDGLGGSATANGTVTGKTDVSRYGPLDATPAFQNAWWTGLNLTPLTDTTYPVMRLVSIPNHWGFVHTDNSLYFCDFANGYGFLNRIHTMKVTYEGDTNDTTVPSAYNVLDLPLGFYPTSINSYGTSVAITALQSVDDTGFVNQGNAALFIWDPTNTVTFDQQLSFPDPIATALSVRNGRLTAVSGNIQRGCRLSEYVGGSTFQEIGFIDDAVPAFAGAVDSQGNRLYVGSYCLEPLESAAVFALNSKTRTRSNDLQNVAVVGTQTAASDQIVTAIKLVSQQTSVEPNPQIVIGASSSSTKELYNRTTGGSGTIGSAWETPMVVVGRKFRLDKVRIPLGAAVTSGTVIEVSAIYDNGASTVVIGTISNSICPSARSVTLKVPMIGGTHALNDFRIKFNYSGVNATVVTPIMFPIEVVLESFDDEPIYGT
jgi:hypothetical protein